MSNEFEIAGLVRQARLGDGRSMDRLAEAVGVRLRGYIYRSTLDRELTEDLCQEVLLEMISSIGSLEKVDSFWPWIFRIASNRIAQHYRDLKREAAIRFGTLEDSLLGTVLADGSEDAGAAAIRGELGKMIVESVSKLNRHQRSVVALRCYEGMSFAEIADSVGCGEVDARVSFFRAKQFLKKQLSKRGFSSSSLLLALLLFGKLTAPSQAAAAGVTLSKAVLSGVGTAAGLRYHLGKILAAAASFMVVCWFCVYLFSGSVSSRADIRSVHFMIQDVEPAGVTLNSSNSNSSSSSSSSSLSDMIQREYKNRAFFERWYYFPEGPDGPVFRREQRWENSGRNGEQCSWLQDGSKNYYYFHTKDMPIEKRRVYITNGPLSCLVMPSDKPEFIDFMFSMLGLDSRVIYNRDPKTGLIKDKTDNRVDSKSCRTKYTYNKVDEDCFKPFWPAYVKVIDQRDEMHKRGWTYFVIDGYMGQEKLSGQGRMPFYYSQYGQYRPWLRLNVGDRFSIVDGCGGAYILDGSGKVLARYSEGTFFRGLGRPWMGINSFDTVCRDSAEQRIPFSFNFDQGHGRVIIKRERDYSVAILDYLVDLERDIIEGISFSVKGGPMDSDGFLRLTYLDDLGGAGEEFVEPKVAFTGSELKQGQMMGVQWLFDLAEGRILN